MTSDERIPPLIPVLDVESVEEAVEFYEELGFSEVFTIPDANGSVVHAHLRKDASVLFLGRVDTSHYAGHQRAATLRQSASHQRGLGVTLILQVDDLAATYALVLSKGLQILAEPADEYYGDRVFFFIDPFGYEWKISQPIPA